MLSMHVHHADREAPGRCSSGRCSSVYSSIPSKTNVLWLSSINVHFCSSIMLNKKSILLPYKQYYRSIDQVGLQISPFIAKQLFTPSYTYSITHVQPQISSHRARKCFLMKDKSSFTHSFSLFSYPWPSPQATVLVLSSPHQEPQAHTGLSRH